jgi:hypothetical protein
MAERGPPGTDERENAAGSLVGARAGEKTRSIVTGIRCLETVS